MPTEWYSRKANLVREEDDEETIKQKEFNQRVVVDKKPYFFNYVYPDLMSGYKQYIASSNRKSLFQFNLTIDELLQREQDGELTEEQAEFLKYYHALLPNSCNQCVMNKICWFVEKEFDGYLRQQTKEVSFDYSILKSGGKYSPSTYRQIESLYELYTDMVERAKTLNKKYKRLSKEEQANELLKIKVNFKTQALRICSNEQELCDMMIDYCYSNGKSKKFVWSIFGEQIVENLLERHDRFFNLLVQDELGDVEFKGLRFKEVKKRLK